MVILYIIIISVTLPDSDTPSPNSLFSQNHCLEISLKTITFLLISIYDYIVRFMEKRAQECFISVTNTDCHEECNYKLMSKTIQPI